MNTNLAWNFLSDDKCVWGWCASRQEHIHVKDLPLVRVSPRSIERKNLPYKAYERDAALNAAIAKKTADDYVITQNDVDWINTNIKDPAAVEFYLANPNEVQKIRGLKGQVDLGLKTNIPEDFNLRQYTAQSLRDESKSRLIEQASGRFTSSQTYDAARQANAFLDAAEMAKTMNSTIGDQVLVKAVEKILQPESSVMQGEADAYRTAGTIIARAKESGVYDAIMKGTEGRLPEQFRNDLIAIARSVGKKRKDSFKNFRNQKVGAAVNNYGWSKAEAEFAYPDPFDGLNIDPELTADDGTVVNPKGAIPTFATEAEAEASGVKGKVIINGRPAEIQ